METVIKKLGRNNRTSRARKIARVAGILSMAAACVCFAAGMAAANHNDNHGGGNGNTANGNGNGNNNGGPPFEIIIAPNPPSVTDSTVALVGTADSPAGSDHWIIVTWGDGTNDERIDLVPEANPWPWSASHSYENPGSYDITATLYHANPNGEDKASTPATTTVTIEEPDIVTPPSGAPSTPPSPPSTPSSPPEPPSSSPPSPEPSTPESSTSPEPLPSESSDPDPIPSPPEPAPDLEPDPGASSDPEPEPEQTQPSGETPSEDPNNPVESGSDDPASSDTNSDTNEETSQVLDVRLSREVSGKVEAAGKVLAATGSNAATFALAGLLFLLGGLLFTVSGGVPRVVIVGGQTGAVRFAEARRLLKSGSTRRD